MSHLAGNYLLPNGHQIPIYQGWSWPAFFFGPFWYLHKGMVARGLLWLLLGIILWIVVLGWIVWIINGAMGNKDFHEHTMKTNPNGQLSPSASGEESGSGSIVDIQQRLPIPAKAGSLICSCGETDQPPVVVPMIS